MRNWITNNYPDISFVSFGPDPVPPDETDTVVVVELKVIPNSIIASKKRSFLCRERFWL